MALEGLDCDLRLIDTGPGALRAFGAPDQTAPHLVLLDLNMPEVDGRLVMKAIRAHRRFENTSIVVITSTYSALDEATCYASGANCYLVKPLEFDEFANTIQAVVKFWNSHELAA